MRNTLRAWMARRPGFAAEIARALETRELYLTDMMLGVGRQGSRNLQGQIDRLAGRRERLRRRREEGLSVTPPLRPPAGR